MSELSTDFRTLPEEYQEVIRRAQEKHGVTIAPLQLLVGGWSGAVVYLVSVSWNGGSRVEHAILKLDHKSKAARSDEVTRHQTVLSKSMPEFARRHIAELVFDHVEHEGALAIFYRIAGQSLLTYRPLSHYDRQSQLRKIFTTTNDVLLNGWNAGATFRQALHPQNLLHTWLGFRLDPGGNIERFLREFCRVDPEVPGFLISGHVFLNPLLYARSAERWSTVRALDAATGLMHGDLNINNILVKFSDNKEDLEGYYLIDFALFKDDIPLFYDQRYLEMSYLSQALSQMSPGKAISFLMSTAVADTPDPLKVPIEAAGLGAVVAAARSSFAAWVAENHPSLHDDLWGQYWLAGVAAGLAYCHKSGQPDEVRLAALIFAASSLRRFSALFALPRPGEVQQLYDEDRGASSHNRSERRSVEGPAHLPNLPTDFIGREDELAAARDLLQRPDVRMVTFTGPGGTGKTRLSLEVARTLTGFFPEGVFFIELADISDPDQVVSRIAKHLEVRAAGSQPLFQNLREYLRDRNILLLLDNFEQLIPAAPAVAELLAAAPALKILVTSRILLNLRGEHEVAILPLDTPALADVASLEELARTESVKLFVNRARAVQSTFVLTESNAAIVAQICQRLDGLPLAIELAAARIKMLPPHAILSRLADRLKLLTGGAHDLPARQQTLRNTLDWSYELLDAQEKILYARLAVFVGGFTLEAAEAVCNAGENLDILEGVTSLVNNSLVRQDTTVDSASRFRMLETIREYALERLSERGELEDLLRSHAHYFAGVIAEEASIRLLGPEATAWLNWLEREHDNIQATLEWTQAAPENKSLAYGLLTPLTWFWYRRGYFNEGRIWSERILAASGSEAGPGRAAALEMNSMMAMWRGDLKGAITTSMESLTLWQRLEDERSMPLSLMETGVVLLNMGRDSEAHMMLKEAEALFRESRQPYFHGITLVHLGNVSLGLGNPEEARGWLEKAHSIFESMGEAWGLSFVLNNLGEVARVQGRYTQAAGYYRESEALLRSTGDKGDLARLIHTLGYIAAEEGDLAGAQAKFQESLAMFRKLGNRRGIAECIAGLASLRVRQGDLRTAATMLGAAEALLGATGAAWWPADRVEVDRTRESLKSALAADEFQQAWTIGQSMSIDRAIALVTDVT